ncbi:hypothetical protein IT401_02170 [Candidatus Nomurabacteria bacterium]|nr:hypothetical protein [Candidatus Nomurabacteria bacterium]
MRKDKEYIFQLRREGKSYRQIQKETGVSRATLGAWFKGVPWSKHLSQEHIAKNLGASKERMERMNMVRKLKLQYQYALIEKEAEKEYEIFKRESLFWAGLMIYAGEGDKRSKNLLRISNADFYIHRIFLAFLRKYLKPKENTIKYCLILYPDLDETVCKNEWVHQLSADQNQFHKTQVIQGKEAVKRLQYGVGMSIIPNTSLKRKVLKWLSLAEKENFE